MEPVHDPGRFAAPVGDRSPVASARVGHHHVDRWQLGGLERRVRYAFDKARAHIGHGEIEAAIDEMLAAERLAPEQVHHHVISRLIIADLRRTTKGERSNHLAQLAGRVQEADHAALGSAR